MRLELTTCGLTIRRSTLLSYRPDIRSYPFLLPIALTYQRIDDYVRSRHMNRGIYILYKLPDQFYSCIAFDVPAPTESLCLTFSCAAFTLASHCLACVKRLEVNSTWVLAF